jgi:hypothetical protein
LECATQILTLDQKDPILVQIVKNLRKNGAYILERYRKKEEEERRKALMRGVNVEGPVTEVKQKLESFDSDDSQ